MTKFKVKRNGKEITLEAAIKEREAETSVLDDSENEAIARATRLVSSQMAIMERNFDKEEGLNKAQFKELSESIVMLKTISKRRLEQKRENILDDMSIDEIRVIVLEALRAIEPEGLGDE